MRVLQCVVEISEAKEGSHTKALVIYCTYNANHFQITLNIELAKLYGAHEC